MDRVFVALGAISALVAVAAGAFGAHALRDRLAPDMLSVFEIPWGDIAAASILASLPPIVIVVGLQRWLVRGLVAGAVKE